jgi:hypothetical protein
MESVCVAKRVSFAPEKNTEHQYSYWSEYVLLPGETIEEIMQSVASYVRDDYNSERENSDEEDDDTYYELFMPEISVEVGDDAISDEVGNDDISDAIFVSAPVVDAFSDDFSDDDFSDDDFSDDFGDDDFSDDDFSDDDFGSDFTDDEFGNEKDNW